MKLQLCREVVTKLWVVLFYTVIKADFRPLLDWTSLGKKTRIFIVHLKSTGALAWSTSRTRKLIKNVEKRLKKKWKIDRS